MKFILNINLLQNKQKSSKAFKSHITVYTIQHTYNTRRFRDLVFVC